MKNQITSKIVKFTFAFMFVLLASSCSDDNDAMDAAVLAKDQINSEISAKGGKPVTNTSYVSTMVYDSPVCVDVSHLFTLSGWNGTASLNVQIYDESTSEYVTIDSFDGQYASYQSLSYTFTEAGVYSLRYQVSGNADNGGTNGFVEFYVTVIDCSTSSCTRINDSAYAGNTVGENSGLPSVGFNNAWWYAFDITGEPIQNVYAGVGNIIGTATYDEVAHTITIDLGTWELDGTSESVKWYSYDSLPTAGRPIPGQADHKGTSLIIDTSNGDQYYVIHLNVTTCQ